MSSPDLPPGVDPSAGGHPAAQPPGPGSAGAPGQLPLSPSPAPTPPPGPYALAPPYGAPYPHAVPGAGNGPAVASLVLGLAGVLVCFPGIAIARPALGLVGVVPVVVVGILAVVFGGAGLWRSRAVAGAGRGMAIAGLVLGIVTVLIGLALAFLVYEISQCNNCFF